MAVAGEAEGKETIVEDRRDPGTAAGSDATDDAEKSDGRVSCLNKNAKKDQRDAMPGYEVYAKARPIMTLWRWVVASLVFLVLGAGAWADLPNSLFGVLFFVAFALAAATISGFYLRSRWIPIGIKRDGERLLITGIADSGIMVASKVEFTSPTSLYVERWGERLASKKMILFFASTEDASKVANWLKPGATQGEVPPVSG